MHLVPLKVKIGLKGSKSGLTHDYPDFNSLPSAVRGNMDWAAFIDQYGGWHYDKCGHANHDPNNDSPIGTWLGMICVPPDFAEAALQAYAGRVFKLTDEEAGHFFECRAHANEPEVYEDVEALKLILLKHQLKEAGLIPKTMTNFLEDDHIARAFDPDDPTPGVRRNQANKWTNFKQSHNINCCD